MSGKTGIQTKRAVHVVRESISVHVVRLSIAGKQYFFGEYKDKDKAEQCLAEAMRIKETAEKGARNVVDVGMAAMREAGFMHPRAAKPTSNISEEPLFPTPVELQVRLDEVKKKAQTHIEEVVPEPEQQSPRIKVMTYEAIVDMVVSEFIAPAYPKVKIFPPQQLELSGEEFYGEDEIERVAMEEHRLQLLAARDENVRLYRVAHEVEEQAKQVKNRLLRILRAVEDLDPDEFDYDFYDDLVAIDTDDDELESDTPVESDDLPHTLEWERWTIEHENLPITVEGDYDETRYGNSIAGDMTNKDYDPDYYYLYDLETRRLAYKVYNP